MQRWLVVGGAIALAYLVFSTRSAQAGTPVPGQPARPLPAAPPVQSPLPPAPAQTTIVPGAASGILEDAQKAANIVGTLADAARRFGIFGGNENGTLVAQRDLSGAAF